MVFSNPTIKLVLIIVNCFNIICSIIHIAVTILNYRDAPEVDSMVLNYISMVISGIFCAAAFMESTTFLEILATTFLSEIVATTILLIYSDKSFFCVYILISMILHGIISAIAYLLTHRLRKKDIQEMITTLASPVMMPLNPLTSGE